MRLELFVVYLETFSTVCAVLMRSALETHQLLLYLAFYWTNPETIDHLCAEFYHSDLHFVAVIEKNPETVVHLEKTSCGDALEEFSFVEEEISNSNNAFS